MEKRRRRLMGVAPILAPNTAKPYTSLHVEPMLILHSDKFILSPTRLPQMSGLTIDAFTAKVTSTP
jgi:hypothetical protein